MFVDSRDQEVFEIASMRRFRLLGGAGGSRPNQTVFTVQHFQLLLLAPLTDHGRQWRLGEARVRHDRKNFPEKQYILHVLNRACIKQSLFFFSETVFFVKIYNVII